MKNKQREPKFKLGQRVIISKGGIKGIVECITVENYSKFDYIVSFSISDIQISEKKLLKLNPISSKPKEPESESFTMLWIRAMEAEVESQEAFSHGDLVEIKRSGVRLYISGASSSGGIYDLGVTWNLGHKAAMKDVTHDSLILIKRNKG